MGIAVEFNPVLALRKYSEFVDGKRKKEECVPEKIKKGKEYLFLKKGQRNYWFGGECPLMTTEGNEKLSRPLASILIVESTHFLIDREVWTNGKYKVVDVFDDEKVHFESYSRIK